MRFLPPKQLGNPQAEGLLLKRLFGFSWHYPDGLPRPLAKIKCSNQSVSLVGIFLGHLWRSEFALFEFLPCYLQLSSRKPYSRPG